MAEDGNAEKKLGIDPAYLKPVLTPEQDQALMEFLRSPEGEVFSQRLATAYDTGAKPKTAIEHGDEMEDGTIYAGISPDTHKPMYARPKDESGTYTFNEAAKHAKSLDAHGHRDFHVPTVGELNALWENRNKGKLKGTFDETGSDPAGWYWSSTPSGNYGAWAQRFSDGLQNYSGRGGGSSLRLVR